MRTDDSDRHRTKTLWELTVMVGWMKQKAKKWLSDRNMRVRTIRVPIGVMPRVLTRPGHSKLEWTTEEDHLRTTSPIETFPVRISDVISCHGFDFSPDGWHPYIETLRQYVENPEIMFEQTILCEYFRAYQPSNVAEVLFNSGSEQYQPLNKWPPTRAHYNFPWWLNSSILEKLSEFPQEVLQDGQHFGPAIGMHAERHFHRLKAVFHSIKDDGYRPSRFRNGYIRGYFIADSSKWRFVLTSNGNHRLAAMHVLGLENILAIQDASARHLTVTPELVEEITRDPLAPFGPDVGFALFDRLLSSNGREKRLEIGI